LAKLAGAAVGNALISGGVASAPSYGKIGLATHVSGTLPVANGGTGLTSLGAGVATFLGTPSSANLAAAVTNETGSGALVFATSPTLVTPALGTPSSGTLTNCTFPTLNQNTTGNAATATTLQTARTIGGVSFNGSANINLPGVNTAGNQNTTGSAATLTTARTIGGVSFNGSANINLPGVNTAGNQNTTGSAASLTTARAINGTNFNGTAAITTANWGTARTIWGQSINGSANITAPVRPAAGSVTAPAFSTSGDTNTGIYFSAADVMNVTTGGTLAATFATNGNFTAVGTVTANSDERLKTDWANLPADFLERLAEVKSGTYTRLDTGARQAGSSAQDWQKLLPEVVTIGDDEQAILSLGYGNAALVAAVELAKVVVELKAELQFIKQQLKGD
jgi:hypothetical protein